MSGWMCISLYVSKSSYISHNLIFVYMHECGSQLSFLITFHPQFVRSRLRLCCSMVHVVLQRLFSSQIYHGPVDTETFFGLVKYSRSFPIHGLCCKFTDAASARWPMGEQCPCVQVPSGVTFARPCRSAGICRRSATRQTATSYWTAVTSTISQVNQSQLCVACPFAPIG